MKNQPDTFLLQQVITGNAAAFATLVDRYKEMVFTLVFRVVRTREDAEELTQDVFMQVYKSLASFRGNSKFSTWLYRIAYNSAISYTRKSKYEFSPLNDDLIQNFTEDEIVDNLDQLDTETQASLVLESINRLPADERALVSLFYTENNTIEEITQITGLSLSNVKVKLFRIRKKLYAGLQNVSQ